MALIKCIECSKEVSDKASVCVHCGYPLEKDMDDFNTEDDFYDRPREMLLQILKQLAEVNVNLELIRGQGIWNSITDIYEKLEEIQGKDIRNSISDLYKFLDKDISYQLGNISNQLVSIETSIELK